MAVSDPVGILISIPLMAGTIIVSLLHGPAAISYALPAIASLVLSHVFFKPGVPRLLLY